MEAPEKLYVDVHDALDDSFLYGFIEKRTDEDIEYVRTDAFIEKALGYLEPILTEYAGFYVGGEISQHFKNYMKEE